MDRIYNVYKQVNTYFSIRSLATFTFIAVNLCSTLVLAQYSAESICGQLAQSHVRSTAASSEFIRTTAAQKWSQCKEMSQIASSAAKSEEARQKVISGGLDVAYGLFGAKAQFSTADLSSTAKFQEALKREESSECGSASNVSELEQKMGKSGVEYFNTFQYVTECLKTLKDQPITFSLGNQTDQNASFAIGVSIVNGLTIQINYDKATVACTSYNGKPFGSKEFCAARDSDNRKECMNNTLVVTPTNAVSGLCVALKEDLPNLHVYISFSGRILSVPVPVKYSKAGQAVMDQLAQTRAQLVQTKATLDASLRDRANEIKVLQATAQNLQGTIQSMQTTIQNMQGTLSGFQTTTNQALRDVNNRVSGIRIVSDDAGDSDFACGGEHQHPDRLTFMYGSRDGTSCGVRNKNYYRTLRLQIP